MSIFFKEKTLSELKCGFSSISLHYIWRNPVFWQYRLHTSPQSCKVHFNATIPNPNDLWLLLFSGMSDEFRKFLEMGLNSLLVHQFLSTNMGAVVIFQKIVLNSNSIQSWMLSWCGNRKHCAWESISDFCFPGIFVFRLKHPSIFRRENCTLPPNQMLFRWLWWGSQIITLFWRFIL